MKAPVENSAEEIRHLQRCMNDLVSLLALPAIWSGGDADQVARVLVDALFGMLRLDFVFVRLNEPVANAPLELARVANSPELRGLQQEIGEACQHWLGAGPQKWPSTFRSPVGDGDISIVALPLGLHQNTDILVAGSRRVDFPHDAERLLLGVAATQAAIALQEARHQSEQKRLASELDRRVAQRTIELAAANEELKAEVAERKRAEQALRDSEGTLRKIINTLPAAAWSTRPDGYCDFLSSRWLEYAGFTVGQAEGWGWGGVIHPADAPSLIQYWQGCLASGEPVDTEARMRRSDGEYRWFLFRANPLRNDDGTIIRWYGTNIDIEDRKRSDEALRASERNLRNLTETIPEMLWSADANGVVDYSNTRFLNYTGFSSEAMMGAGWQETIHPEDVEPATQAWLSSVTTGAPYEVEVRTFHAPDDAYRWCAVAALPLLDEQGRILKWHGTAVDIHDRKLAQEKLLQSERDARLIVDSIPAQVAVLGPAGEIMHVNRQMAEYFGKYTDVLDDWKTGDIVPADELPRVRAGMALSLETGQPFQMENHLRRHDGVYRWIQVRGAPLLDAGGRALRWYFLCLDIEERKLAEEALDKVRSELAHVSRSMSLGALAASIAHEVNQPLSGIVTNASTCVRLLTADPPNVDGALETARRTIRDGNRAAQVVARLRALFDKKTVTSENVDLNEAAREVISLMSSDLRRSQVNLQVELDDDSLLVTGDRVQLQQVILNLLRNASDAMSSVCDRPRDVLIRTEREDEDHVRLTVKDVGIGLDKAELDKLFDAFFTTKNDGMGVGLSVSRTIIESHRGRLWATLNEGPGATFAFSIPCHSDDAAATT